MKRAFTLSEILITMMIISIMVVILLQTLRPEAYESKTNLANARKTIEDVSHAFVQITDMETISCPTRSYMLKPAGLEDWEFSIYNSSGDKLTTSEFVNLLGNYLKYEASQFAFCDTTDYCTSDSVVGARLAGGVIIGIEKFESIQDCPDYRIPGEETNHGAPTEFNPRTGNQDAIQCWGQLYIDVRGPNKGKDTLGNDIYTFGLGEYGIVR